MISCNYTIVDLFSGHNIQAQVISIFIPPAIQSTTCILPVPSDINPPTTAPISMHVKASILLFLLTLSLIGAISFGSEERSQSIDVTTTLGISAKLNVLLPMIWPEDWKLKIAIGIRDLHTMSLGIVLKAPSTTPAWIIAADRRMSSDCRRNDATRVLRRSGPANRERCEKKKQPRQKQEIDVKDLAQP